MPIVIAGGALVAGYTTVEDMAFVSGNCVVHQYVRIGRLAVMRGLSRTSRDVPPFCILDHTHTVRGTNVVGLRRAGFSRERIGAVRGALRALFFGTGNINRAMERIEAEGPISDDVAYLLQFIRASKRGVATGPRRRRTTATTA